MSKVDELLKEFGMTRENWECDPRFVADLINALDEASPPATASMDANDAARYRWLRENSLGTRPEIAISYYEGREIVYVTELYELDSVTDAGLEKHSR